MRLLRALYDLGFILGLFPYVALCVWKRKMSRELLSGRLGMIGRAETQDTVWIQAVSVGEVNVIAALVERLLSMGHRIVISTTTMNGQRLARERYGRSCRVIFFPFDISFIVRRVARLLRPRLFVSVETELWPNLFFHLKDLRVPVVIINGRISDGAFARYRRIKPLMRRIISCCTSVAVQNEEYKDRFVSLGCEPSRITVSGTMKFETIEPDLPRLVTCERKYAGLLPDDGIPLLVAGSTHPGEEEIVLAVYSRLLETGRKCRLLIAPRHVERVFAVEQQVREHGYRPVRISCAQEDTGGGVRVFILDVIGELRYFYRCADLCFVGGSFRPHGGHNILEPIFFSKPVLFGPHMENFRDVEALVLRYNAGIKVANAPELETALRRLIDSQGYRASIVRNCGKVFSQAHTSVEEHMELISQSLHERPV